MTGYLVRRLIGAVVVLFMLSFIVFMLVNAVPGNTLTRLLNQSPQGANLTPAQIEQYERDLGLDRPVLERYGNWLWSTLQGDLGESFATRLPVWQEIQDRLPKSIELVILATLISTLLAIPIGVFSAVRQGGIGDYASRIFAILGLAVPNFFLAVLVVTYAAAWGGVSLSTLDPPYIWDGVWDNLAGMIAPALVLSASLMATVMRMQRSTVLEVVNEDYVRTARAKGLGERVVILRHVLRNSLIPVITIFANQFAFLISGAVIVEFIFRIDGIGALAVRAIRQVDFTLVLGISLVVGFGVVFINILVDVSYAWLDPRIRYS